MDFKLCIKILGKKKFTATGTMNLWETLKKILKSHTLWVTFYNHELCHPFYKNYNFSAAYPDIYI